MFRTDASRRQILQRLVVTAAGGMMMPRDAFAQAAAGATQLLPHADVCVMTPASTEGPYYFDPKLVRSDITEGRPGVPVTVRLQMVDQACKPLPGARMDIWHCDALGLYSNYPGQGDDRAHPINTKGATYLRGTQMADERGVVDFKSIYPGWYPGRTTHIHFKAFINPTSVLTGQIFFPDAVSDVIYKNKPPYAGRKLARDTLNARDFIARSAGSASLANVKEDSDGYLVSMIIGVRPSSGGSRR
ncbi:MULTISPECIES: intradiol ring-cleavage dioxygenase [unclassified Beijerinckia]|uniref:intradiol ring-cleavage dioxygenase n=1 Tax=unclassified Beijerinckia TaxID=2638183 RepID=UPI000898CF70|nr:MULTISPECIES: intradiol ring-cleavage dioxygenase [unclassified Beijerinckia]MDH7796195.1 protocatechuate 3,4-dioxygenase beta subunit [Beijerinckia sp. GAS462]SEC34477.1 Dioxygenase [Beijerinckia sp. 28-YEA-48]